MFEDRTHNRTFYSAPQRVRSLIAAFLEPGLTVTRLWSRCVEFDLESPRKESLGLGPQIIARTIRVAFFDKNAYRCRAPAKPCCRPSRCEPSTS